MKLPHNRLRVALIPMVSILGASTCLFSASAVAQAIIPRPSVTQPSQVQQQLRIEDERPQVGGTSVITLPDASGQDKPLRADANFTLKGLEFDHVTVFTETQLRSEYVDYIGKDINLRILNQIANNITAKYRNAGYILSRAVVPPQRIENGMVKVRLVEGYVNKVSFADNSDHGSRLLNAYAQKIREARPLDAKTLERYLLLMNDLPGVSAQAVLRPSQDAPEASDVIITVSNKRVDGSLTVDNRGSRYLGPVEFGATAAVNNVLGVYDRTELRGVITPEISELKYGEVVHEEQLGDEGTKVAFSAGYTHTHPGYRLEDFDVLGRDVVYSAAIAQPFIRTRETNLFGNAEFDVRQTVLDALGSQLYDDKLKVFRFGGSYDFVDSISAINRFDTQVSKGFPWDTTSNTGLRSRPDAKPSFAKITGDYSRLQPISGPFSLFGAATAQFSGNTLMTAEQFSIGGADFGSAYDPSELLGDSGAAARVELQYAQSTNFKYVPNYQLYGFYDAGTVWNRDAFEENEKVATLTDTGFGARFNVLQPLSGGVEFALPLTKPVAANGEDGYGPRVFFSLAYRY